MLIYGAHYVLTNVAERVKSIYRISRSSLQDSLPGTWTDLLQITFTEIDLPHHGYPPSLRDNEDAVIATTHRVREEDGISIISRSVLESDALSEQSTGTTATARDS